MSTVVSLILSLLLLTFFSNVTARAVTARAQHCPPGYVVPRDRSGVCEVCRAGYSSSVNDADQCTPCAAGYYSHSGASQCLSCPPGYYSDAAAPSCTSCPPGMDSVDYSSSSCTASDLVLYVLAYNQSVPPNPSHSVIFTIDRQSPYTATFLTQITEDLCVGLRLSPQKTTAYTICDSGDFCSLLTVSLQSPYAVTTLYSNQLDLGGEPSDLAVSPDGTTAYVPLTGVGGVVSLSLQSPYTKTVIMPNNNELFTNYVALSPNGMTLYVLARSSNVTNSLHSYSPFRLQALIPSRCCIRLMIL